MEISFEKIIRIVKKNALIIIAAALVFFGIALAVMKFVISPTYTISAKFYISDPTRQQGGTASYSDYNYETRVVNTYVEMLKSKDFFELVYSKLSEENAHKTSAAQIQNGASFSVVTNTEIISASFQNSDHDLVYPVMSAILDTAEEYISRTYNREDIESNNTETPNQEDVKVSNNRTKIVCAIAAVLGALAAVAFFYIRDALDVHIRGANDITEKYKLPVLGRIPNFDTSALRKKEAAGDGKAKE